MTIQDWASLIVAILTIVSSIGLSIKWLVKHYLSELKTNGGSSVKDQMNRMEKELKEHNVIHIFDKSEIIFEIEKLFS